MRAEQNPAADCLQPSAFGNALRATVLPKKGKDDEDDPIHNGNGFGDVARHRLPHHRTNVRGPDAGSRPSHRIPVTAGHAEGKNGG